MGVKRSLGVVKTTSSWGKRAAHGIMATHRIMPHETTLNENGGAV
jgi:hypothetical protein